MERIWSEYQRNIFDFIAKGVDSVHSQGKKNAIIRAVAGSGKSTTIVEGMRHAQGYNVFLAFNKTIAEELKARGVNARTFHSLCYAPVTKARKASQVDPDKLRRVMMENWPREQVFMYGAFATRLVGLARQIGIDVPAGPPNTYNTWMGLCIQHDIEPENENADFGRGIELAQELLELSNNSHLLDFDDLLYLAVRDNILLPKFSFVFVDEAQDTNWIQRELLRKIMTHDSRLIAVGDPAQAIYGFRGADASSLANIGTEFDCVELPLTVSYRCPTSVIEYAQAIVPDIQARPGAPEGKVHKLKREWGVHTFKDNDLVVCRTTRHLIGLAFKMLKNRIPVQVMGNDIGAGLKSLIKKMNARDIDDLQSKVEKWRDREESKAAANDLESKAAAVADKANTILQLIDFMQEDKRTIEQLVKSIDDLFFPKERATIKFATIHKAKGLEADRVFWLNSSQCPPRWVKKDWQLQQEMNLCYVAITRAKEELFLIEE